MASQDGPDHGDSESRQNASSREQERASEGAFTLIDLITAIQAMGETQREMMDTIKELKSSVSKPPLDITIDLKLLNYTIARAWECVSNCIPMFGKCTLGNAIMDS
ncbi:PREDICTED: LOC110752859 [Prunus dulcis]|uniref:PREDICTED: LOC110752859 n=1 Tax=Prunus dulcis TaxID=3755 RepID=A0A5E4FQ03_PRUDU|nr:PREDICTED: LOC110752859 [Prunus dulcis]